MREQHRQRFTRGTRKVFDLHICSRAFSRRQKIGLKSRDVLQFLGFFHPLRIPYFFESLRRLVVPLNMSDPTASTSTSAQVFPSSLELTPEIMVMFLF